MPETTSLTALAERLELWPLDRLRPYERNPWTHSADQVAHIAPSMVEFGFTNPILVDESDGILAGHGRLMAARQLGLAVPTTSGSTSRSSSAGRRRPSTTGAAPATRAMSGTSTSPRRTTSTRR